MLIYSPIIVTICVIILSLYNEPRYMLETIRILYEHGRYVLCSSRFLTKCKILGFMGFTEIIKSEWEEWQIGKYLEFYLIWYENNWCITKEIIWIWIEFDERLDFTGIIGIWDRSVWLILRICVILKNEKTVYLQALFELSSNIISR